VVIFFCDVLRLLNNFLGLDGEFIKPHSVNPPQSILIKTYICTILKLSISYWIPAFAGMTGKDGTD
jgi:hypothetical protein